MVSDTNGVDQTIFKVSTGFSDYSGQVKISVIKWTKILASIQSLSMQIHGVLVKKIRENIEQREQAGALVATRCTLSTLRVCFSQTALQTNTNLIHI